MEHKMAAETKAIVRCAIYTRKSSEEGLEQFFNSLDAQREACHAYILSQRHEGWRVVDRQYDDGGYSGGSMERPGLTRLLQDIDAGRIDTIVVYKVDRLTRSLADFAKMIEGFDAGSVSFVSVTQQFNTTTSMGRLTLNILLSFAQFERELTGERIRDKIAASKRRGMWMGGTIPLGYDLKDRKLIVNPKEADRVREIFRLYLELGCVAKLKTHLDRKNITSKVRISTAGNKSGGASYSRGSLYDILQNRIYLGEITHRDESFAGQHQAIVAQELWDKVQARLAANNQARRNGSSAKCPSLLSALIYDELGNRFTPSHAVKNGKRYRYYVSQAAIHHRTGAKGPSRIPGHDIEDLVCRRLRTLLGAPNELLKLVTSLTDEGMDSQAVIGAGQALSSAWESESSVSIRQFLHDVVARVVVLETGIQVLVRTGALIRELLRYPGSPRNVKVRKILAADKAEDLITLDIDTRLKRCGGEVRLVLPADSVEETKRRPLPSLIKAIARAHDWYEQIVAGGMTGRRSIGKATGLDERYVAQILHAAFLAPDIVDAILDGQQPVGLTMEKLRKRPPVDWQEQRTRLGFT
jgi:site-specific DNA recombinase